MADAIVSAVAERIIAMVEEQIRKEVNLVRGVDEEVLKLSDELTRLRNVLDDAENRRFKDKNINYWLFRLEQTSYEMEDVLDEWNYALLRYSSNHLVLAPSTHKVCSYIPSSSCFKKVVVRRDIANKIKNVKGRLDQILKEKDEYNFITSQLTVVDPSPQSWRVQSTSLIDLGQVFGRDNDKDILVSKLVDNGGGQYQELGNVHVVSIVGVGGLGKTTLAQLVYNDSRVKECFEFRIWICVSDPFDLAAIAKGILEGLGKGSSSHTNQLNFLFKHVQDSISGKRFLLVLDDVWTEDYSKWEPLENALRCGGVGSKILVTTRNERVAKIMHTIHVHHPGQLSDEDCWLVLSRMALFGKNNEVLENFEDIGKRIAEKCKGLPLAAKTLGSLLCFKNTLDEWKNVLNSEVWEMKEAKVDIFPHLLLSYNELSPTLKRCFSYCAVFYKDEHIYVDELIRNWMALGYLGSEGDLEGKGQEYFDILVMHSLFQDFEQNDSDGRITSCKMHDIVHDFALFLRKSSRVETVAMSKTTCQVCDPLAVSSVNEFLSLFLKFGVFIQNPCNCLIRLRVLDLYMCGMQSLPRGMLNLIHLRLLVLTGNPISNQDLKIIFQLYYLQTLNLSDCSLKEISKEIGYLINLRYLNLSSNRPLKKLPREIGKLIRLRDLNLDYNDSLKELPKEIGKLIQLRHLHLNYNNSLKELPESLCDLLDLQTLGVDCCKNLFRLPEGIEQLTSLRKLSVACCENLSRLPEGVGQLTSLRELSEFHGGSGGNKMRSLKNLNNLSGSVMLSIRLDKDIDSEEMVEDVEEAQVRNKKGIQKLVISFKDDMDENEESGLVRTNVMDALEPHPKLEKLAIWGYQLPGWLFSSLNQLRKLDLSDLTSLPPLEKLSCLEKICLSNMDGLQFVGRELLGIRGREDMKGILAFPKLKKLKFVNWKEWEDITSEEEGSAGMTIMMPCLTDLKIIFCQTAATSPVT